MACRTARLVEHHIDAHECKPNLCHCFERCDCHHRVNTALLEPPHADVYHSPAPVSRLIVTHFLPCSSDPPLLVAVRAESLWSFRACRIISQVSHGLISHSSHLHFVARSASILSHGISLLRIICEQLIDQVDVGHEHAPAAVTFATQHVHSLTIRPRLAVFRCLFDEIEVFFVEVGYDLLCC